MDKLTKAEAVAPGATQLVGGGEAVNDVVRVPGIITAGIGGRIRLTPGSVSPTPAGSRPRGLGPFRSRVITKGDTPASQSLTQRSRELAEARAEVSAPD